jgi:hypothetical protein
VKTVKIERVTGDSLHRRGGHPGTARQFEEFLCSAQKPLDLPEVAAYMPVRAALQQNRSATHWKVRLPARDAAPAGDHAHGEQAKDDRGYRLGRRHGGRRFRQGL